MLFRGSQRLHRVSVKARPSRYGYVLRSEEHPNTIFTVDADKIAKIVLDDGTVLFDWKYDSVQQTNGTRP